MAFWGHTFIFDDIPCSDFGLMVYHFGSTGQDDVLFQSGSIIEDRVPGRYDSLLYGLEQNQALEYTLVFGANLASIDRNESIDRYEVEAIASWLTGHQTRKWLTIVQDDMESFRYKCLITELKLITYGDMPWAFSCKVNCDSPFAYTFPEETTFTISGIETVNFFNRSTYNGYYYPKLEITMGNDWTALQIENLSDGNRMFQFSDIPLGELNNNKIYVDNKNMIITNDRDLNFYKYFNMNFLRLVRGDNQLKIRGRATIKFICEFPVNVGG